MLAEVLTDLHDESADLDRLVAGLSDADWSRPTPSPGWTIAHQIAHLTWTDRVATIAATDPAGFDEVLTAALADPTGFVDRAATVALAPPPELLARWRTGRQALSDTLAAMAPGTKAPWFGPPLSAASMATGRIMETWAHGEDVAGALGVTRPPTARLRHVAWLGYRTLPNGFAAHGRAVPTEPVRVELVAPDGTQWTFGPEEAENRLAGSRAGLLPPGHPAPAPRRPRPAGHRTDRGRVARRGTGVRRSAGYRPRAGRRAPVTTLRIGNASGFYGDRFAAWREMLDGGDLDVLTGDYLAELTMLILAGDRRRDPSLGYARTFLRQMEQCLGTALERGVGIVTNAGGLNPAGLADTLRALASRLGLMSTSDTSRVVTRTRTSARSASPRACAPAPTWW